MDSDIGSCFTSLTHGKCTDCRQANAHIRDKLEAYNFGAFITEKSCFRCPNDDCNLSFIFILPKREYLRLKHHVKFDVRPNFLHHTSFKELVLQDLKSITEKKSIGVQVFPDMMSKYIDASAPTMNTTCQTDFMAGKKDEDTQTEKVVIFDLSECSTQQPPVQEVQTAPVEKIPFEASIIPEETVAPETSKVVCSHICPQENLVPTLLAGVSLPVTAINESLTQDQCFSAIFNGNRVSENNNSGKCPESLVSSRTSPVRSLEIQQDHEDDEVVFVEIRQRDSLLPMREFKQEPMESELIASEALIQVAPILPIQEVKEEPVDQAHSAITVTSETLSATALGTPSSCNRKRSIRNEQLSAKKIKFSDVEICSTCLEVTHFESLDEYCAHVLDVHFSSFNCKFCQKTFFDAHHARLHAQSHRKTQEGHLPQRDQSADADFSDGDLEKFIRVATECYPDKFRNVLPGRIYQIIKTLS